MTRGEAIAEVALGLGNRTDLDAQIGVQLQRAQRALEEDAALQKLPFLLSEYTRTNTTAGEERVALPVDFLGEYDEGTLWIYDATLSDPWKELEKGWLEELKAYYVGEGEPKEYALSGGYFRLFPTPDDAYELRMLYWQRQPTLVNLGDTNAWLTEAADLLIAETGVRTAKYVRDAAALKMFAADRQVAYDRAMRMISAREVSNTDFVMGGA